MRYRLLVVDDDGVTRTCLKKHLTSRGYDVDCVNQAEEAMDLLSRLPYAAVITDLHLTAAEGREGLAVVVEVRRRWPSTRVILFTGHPSDGLEAAARRLGADAFLQKARPLGELEQAVRSLMEPAP